MVKVETYIKFVMEMTLAEARELHDVLGHTTGRKGWAHFDSLDEALKLFKEVEVEA